MYSDILSIASGIKSKFYFVTSFTILDSRVNRVFIDAERLFHTMTDWFHEKVDDWHTEFPLLLLTPFVSAAAAIFMQHLLDSN